MSEQETNEEMNGRVNRNAWVIYRANQYIESGYEQAAREARFIRAMDTLQLQGFVTSLEIEGVIRYRLTEKGKEFFT